MKTRILFTMALGLSLTTGFSQENPKRAAQKMADKLNEQITLSSEQREAVEEQAEAMVENTKRALSKAEKQQLSQNFQMSLDRILTEEQKVVKKQKKEEIKVQRRKFQQQ